MIQAGRTHCQQKLAPQIEMQLGLQLEMQTDRLLGMQPDQPEMQPTDLRMHRQMDSCCLEQSGYCRIPIQSLLQTVG